MLDDLARHAARQVDRYREADPLDAEVLGHHRGVDADQFAARVDERAAGIAFVDRRIGLDEVLEGCHAELPATDGADDAVRDGLLQAQRIADRQHLIAHLQLVRTTERHDRKPRQIDLNTARSVSGSLPTTLTRATGRRPAAP